MKFPLVRELAAEGFPVRLTCGVLGFSTQAFYKWQATPVSQRDYDDAHLVIVIHDVHEDDPEFGYRLRRDRVFARQVRPDAIVEVGQKRAHDRLQRWRASPAGLHDRATAS